MNETRDSGAPAEAVELTQAQLAELVDRFYEQVRVDPELGPVFNAAIDDWPEHKRMLTEFWSSVALGTRSYRGNPMAAHRPHPIRAEHFDRWLALWRQTASEVLPAEHVERVAHRLATAARADLVVVVDDGRIVECGPHEELRRAGGLYTTLWQLATGGLVPETTEALLVAVPAESNMRPSSRL